MSEQLYHALLVVTKERSVRRSEMRGASLMGASL